MIKNAVAHPITCTPLPLGKPLVMVKNSKNQALEFGELADAIMEVTIKHNN